MVAARLKPAVRCSDEQRRRIGVIMTIGLASFVVILALWSLGGWLSHREVMNHQPRHQGVTGLRVWMSPTTSAPESAVHGRWNSAVSRFVAGSQSARSRCGCALRRSMNRSRRRRCLPGSGRMAAVRLMLALLGRQARVDGGVGMEGSGTALPSSTWSLCRRSGATGLPPGDPVSSRKSARQQLSGNTLAFTARAGLTRFGCDATVNTSRALETSRIRRKCRPCRPRL